MQQREILRPQYGEPLVFRLDVEPEDAVEKEGKFGGLDWQYFVNDGAAIVYLPMDGRNALLKSGARAGDLVSISKSKRGRSTLFSAEVQSDAAEPPPPPPRAAAPPQPHQRVNERQPLPNRVYAQPETGPANGNGHSNGNGYHRPAPQPAPAKAPTPMAPFADYLCLAIDAVAIAQNYGREKGVSCTFLGGDIRAIATTLYINGAENGGRR